MHPTTTTTIIKVPFFYRSDRVFLGKKKEDREFLRQICKHFLLEEGHPTVPDFEKTHIEALKESLADHGLIVHFLSWTLSPHTFVPLAS